MGDMGEIFNAMKEASQEKRANNRASSAQLLTDAGIDFVSKNAGAHLIVEDRIDFWPGTGLWIVRGETKKHRGIRKLITRIGDSQK